MTNVCIFGGSGFIGSALVEKLLDLDKYKIVIVDLKKPAEHILNNSKVRFVEFDLSDVERLKRQNLDFLTDIDVLFFKVGMLGDPSRSSDCKFALGYLETNVYSMLVLLERMQSYNVKKIIVDSSITAISNPYNSYNMNEDVQPREPLNFYSMSKAILEDACRFYSENRNIYVFRYSRVQGTSVPGVILKVIRAVNNLEEIKLIGDPDKILDFVSIEDVVDANVALISMDPDQKVFHLSCQEHVTLSKLIDRILIRMGKSSYPILIDKDGPTPKEPRLNSLDSYRSYLTLELGKPRSLDYIIDEVIKANSVV